MPKFTLITIGVVFLSFYALPSFAHPGSFMELVTLPVESHVLFIPEPSEFLLLASGIGMLALLGRYRRVRTR